MEHALRCILGLAFFCVLGWLWSGRQRPHLRTIVAAIALQFALGLIVLRTDFGAHAFQLASDFAQRLIGMTEPGAQLVFGDLARADGPAGFVFAFAGRGLVVILFLSALTAVLYHLGILQLLVWLLARVMSACMRLSGAESLVVAANVFIGMTEAPLVVRPYIARMTRSELMAMMTGGFATIAGSVMAVYMGLLGPEYGPHLIAASVMSAPAAFAMAKLMLPETEAPQTAGRPRLVIERSASNVVEAAAIGTSDGLKLWLNVVAMLIAFVALVHFIDWPLGWIGGLLGVEGGLTLARLFGWALAPVAWIMGVDGWHDCQLMGSLLGTKLSINELVAYQRLIELLPGAGAQSFEHERSATMAAYALCGFANFGSIGIQIGGLTPLVPERRAEIARLAPRAMVAGACASWMTAVVVGALL